MFENIDRAIEAVEAICAGPAVAGDPADLAAGILTDAHKYTRTLIRNGYVRLHEADEQFIHSTRPDLSWVALVAEIRCHADSLGPNYPADQRAFLNRILDMTTAFVNSPQLGFEGAESHISIPDLLLRCWNLAKAAAQRTGDRSLLTQILNCLDGNIADGGGCMPGVVARLFPAYARLLQYHLGNLRRPAARTTAIAVATARDENLEAAIRASLAPQQPTTTFVNPQEAADLAAAIRASLQQISAATVTEDRDMAAAIAASLADDDQDLEGLTLALQESMRTTTARQEPRPAPPMLIAAATRGIGAPPNVPTQPPVMTAEERMRRELAAATRFDLSKFKF